MAQWYCVAQGQRYGPVEEPTLQEWVRQGRVLAGDLVWAEGLANWAPAGSFPQFFPTPATGPQAPSAGPAAPSATQVPAAGVYPGAQPQSAWQQPYTTYQPQPYSQAMLMPHRGTLILVFGILSWTVCVVFGIIAWVMGSSDLRKMREGLMDPAGRGSTRAGQLLGMIHVIVAIIVFIVMMILVVTEPKFMEGFENGMNEGMADEILRLPAMFF